jgi:uncharacterized phiE125 gp8 family phage protein
MDIPGYTGEDDTIEDLIASAVDYVETECNLSLGVSTYEWYPDCLPGLFPDTVYVQNILSIDGTNSTGTALIDAANYSLIKTGSRGRKIKWIDSFKSDHSAFKVTFKAGFEDGKIPPRLLMALRALVAEWYDNRGNLSQEKKTFVDNLLAPYVIAYVA